MKVSIFEMSCKFVLNPLFNCCCTRQSVIFLTFIVAFKYGENSPPRVRLISPLSANHPISAESGYFFEEVEGDLDAACGICKHKVDLLFRKYLARMDACNK